ncbi:MAG: ABC transporter substrate-binding protein [Methanocorpusculum sp.]|nr:ABC transporter substrate-binding protein [Methanocorpusculum sp.]
MQKKLFLAGGVLLLAFAVILTAGCVGEDTSGKPTVEVVEIAAGQQVSSLGMGQIDGMINWQPNVAAATESGIGKVISYSQNLPRSDGKTWEEHTCCVFGANEQGIENNSLAAVLTGLMLLGNEYITEHPKESAAFVADWLYGNTDPTFGDKTVSGTAIIEASLPTIRFSTEISDTWLTSNYEFLETQRTLGTIVNHLKNTSREETEELIYDFKPYYTAAEALNAGTLPEPVSKDITIGYLISDHDSPLFVLLKNWEFFKNTCNAYIKPAADKSGPVEKAELYVNGKKICNVSLVAGSGGPNLMTMLQTNTIQYAVAGTPPFLSSIDTQPGLKILSPIMTEGSALVVAADAPANTWAEFAAWAKERSAAGQNLVIAIPQVKSIQDVQLKDALESAGITYKVKSA